MDKKLDAELKPFCLAASGHSKDSKRYFIEVAKMLEEMTKEEFEDYSNTQSFLLDSKLPSISPQTCASQPQTLSHRAPICKHQITRTENQPAPVYKDLMP